MIIDGFNLTVQKLHDGTYEGTYLHKRERWTVSAVADSAEGALIAVKTAMAKLRARRAIN